MNLQLHPFYFASMLIVWALVYNASYWITAIVCDRSLVFWSLGVLGVSAVGLEEPSLGQVMGQLFGAGLALAGTAYASLFWLHPAPVGGLALSLREQIGAILLLVAAFSLVRGLVILRDRYFPMWGEARVLIRVQKSLATGAVIVFTQSGRTFVRERFGASPDEFLAMVRA